MTSCPVCFSDQVHHIMDIPYVPVHCNRLWSTREEALSAPRGGMQLVFCKACTHVFNASFDPKLVEYSPGYENSLHFSPRFQKYAADLAQRLIYDYDIFGKSIIEIGCGNGDFLSMLCNLGNNKGFGFDPSASSTSHDISESVSVNIFKDYYSDQYSDIHPSLVCCRHVLEHIESPIDFLKSITKTLGNKSSPIFYFEVPNFLFTLQDNGIWDLIFEHYSYYSLNSLHFLFYSLDFKILRCNSDFMNQFICLDAIHNKPFDSDVRSDQFDLSGFLSQINNFSKHFNSVINKWKSFFDHMISPCSKVVIWGAGSKGVTFLNVLNIFDQVQYVVDINPHKQGLYIPGTGQKVINPDQLVLEKPDIVIIMNPVYQSEIKNMLHNNGLDPLIYIL